MVNWHAVWLVVRDIGAITGPVLLAVYFWPGSPLKKIVDSWISGRVDHYFDKALADYQHQLTVQAEQVRARHQRLLQNSAIVVERKHEVYRRLFHLLHVAMGAVTVLFGSGHEPPYNTYDKADVEHYMRVKRFPRTIKTA